MHKDEKKESAVAFLKAAVAYYASLGVQSTLSVWPPGEEPLPPKPWSGRGRKPSRLRHDAEHRPVSAKELAMRLSAEVCKDVKWREGSDQTLSSRFAAVRVRPASRNHKLVAPPPVEWLVVEWPEGEAEPTKILALDLARGYAARGSRRRHQAAMAHRTRLLSSTPAAGRPP